MTATILRTWAILERSTKRTIIRKQRSKPTLCRFGGNLAKEKKTPAGKALRAVVVEISDYLDCVMVQQDGCEAEFKAKEQRRRSKLKDSVKLD